MHILSVIFYNRPCNYCESSLVTLLHIDHFNIIFKSLRHFSQGCFLCCYPSLRDINTTHSTWLDTFILMSDSSSVCGNISTQVHKNISTGFFLRFKPVRKRKHVNYNIFSLLYTKQRDCAIASTWLQRRVHGIFIVSTYLSFSALYDGSMFLPILIQKEKPFPGQKPTKKA